MPSCIVNQCLNKSGRKGQSKDIKLHLFPNNKERIISWLKNTGQQFNNIEAVASHIFKNRTQSKYALCSEHFSMECYYFHPKGKTLKPDALPTIFPKASDGTIIIEETSKKRTRKKILDTASSSDCDLQPSQPSETSSIDEICKEGYRNCSTQTDSTLLNSKIIMLEDEIPLQFLIPVNTSTSITKKHTAASTLKSVLPSPAKKPQHAESEVGDISTTSIPKDVLILGVDVLDPITGQRCTETSVDTSIGHQGLVDDLDYLPHMSTLDDDSSLPKGFKKTKLDSNAKLYASVMPSCIVNGCIHKTTKKSCNDDGVIMHAFPSSLSRIRQWLRSIEKYNHQYFGNIDALSESIYYKKNNSSFRICSDHFPVASYAPGYSKRRSLRQDAIPSIFSAPLSIPAGQQMPFMVDAITQTDPYTNTEDKGAQWPEFEFNIGGQPWKIEHDHVYHTSLVPARIPPRTFNPNSHVNAKRNSMIYELQVQQSSQEKEPVVLNVSHASVFSDRGKCRNQKNADEKCVNERKFIVFESCLDVLFERVRCKIGDCNAPIFRTQKHVLGSYLSVAAQCHKGHTFHLWHSQPTRGEVALGNVLSSAAILFSGSHFQKVQEMCQLLGLQFLSPSLYDLYHQKYLIPTVDVHWQQERLRLNASSLGTRLCLTGSGQCTTYDNDLKYGIYTFLDVATKRIVDFECIRGTKAKSCAALKKKAFVRCLNRILKDQFEVATIATDDHPKLRKTCEQNYRIQHEYDAWEYTKSIEKRLLAASKKKNCSVLAEWIPSIKKHLWWCSSVSKGNAEVLRELWQSLLMHVTDRHEWAHGGMFHMCAHRRLTKLERDCLPWIKENSQPYLALYDVVMNPKVLKDLHHLSQFLHTGEIEVYHHFLSKYRPKQINFKLNALEARIKLAALAHNANVHKPRAKANSLQHGKAAIGTLRLDGDSVWEKSCISKTLSGSSTNSHTLLMMTDVLKFFDYQLLRKRSLWTAGFLQNRD